jgi:hypothetical protein
MASKNTKKLQNKRIRLVSKERKRTLSSFLVMLAAKKKGQKPVLEHFGFKLSDE